MTTSTTNASTAEPAHSTNSIDPNALITPKAVRLSQTAPRCPPSDYETDPVLHHMTKKTRRLGRTIPVSWQHGLRDNGWFRWIADSMVATLAIPVGAITCPSAARDFVQLSHDRTEQLRYGDHESQFIDVFLPPPGKAKARGMVFFVHGGAWGSGKPWFYRLVAKPFLQVGLAVAIVGYRVYPLCSSPGSTDQDRGGVRTQVDDLDAALRKLAQEYPAWCDKNHEDSFVTDNNNKDSSRRQHLHHLPHLGTIVVGHSSGAHISLLWMVEKIQKSVSDANHNPTANNQTKDVQIAAFVGVSGVYNIGHHFDYEAGRGVEELSPLKPANGYDRRSFCKHSPPWKVQHEILRKLNELDHSKAQEQLLSFPDRILLIHGAEDDVVPLPGTGEAAKLLKQCLGGGSSCSNSGNSDRIIDELYVPNTGHQETVVDLMMVGGHEGPVTRSVVQWILDGNRQLKSLPTTGIRRTKRRTIPSTLRSKL